MQADGQSEVTHFDRKLRGFAIRRRIKCHRRQDRSVYGVTAPKMEDRGCHSNGCPEG